MTGAILPRPKLGNHIMVYDGLRTIWCSGLERIENAGNGNLRFYLFEEKNGSCEPVAEIVCPAAAVPDAIMKAICALTALGITAAVKTPLLDILMN